MLNETFSAILKHRAQFLIFFLYHRKEEMPVVFLPQDSPEDCQGSESAMSAFGFLSFAMAVVNGVINAANNINNNNNK